MVTRIFHHVYLYQIAGFLQQLAALFAQVSQVQGFTCPDIAFREGINRLNRRVVGDPRVLEFDNDIIRIVFRINRGAQLTFREKRP